MTGKLNEAVVKTGKRYLSIHRNRVVVAESRVREVDGQIKGLLADLTAKLLEKAHSEEALENAERSLSELEEAINYLEGEGSTPVSETDEEKSDREGASSYMRDQIARYTSSNTSGVSAIRSGF